MSEAKSEAQRGPKKGRSPSYPGIDLQAAIRRAEALYAHEKMHPAPIGAIVGHWGYTTHKSGIASSQYAALKKFGLLTEEGSGNNRQGKLTPLAYSILHNPNEPERSAAIREAALNPQIHRELWEMYGADLPSEATLRYRLVTERGFTEAGADDFVKEYRSTLDFAMTQGDMRDGSDKDEVPDETNSGEGDGESEVDAGSNGSNTHQQTGGHGPGDDSGQTSKPVHTPNALHPHLTRIPILLVGGQQIVIEGQFPITEAAWDNFLAVLNAFKPGLVEAQPTTPESSNG